MLLLLHPLTTECSGTVSSTLSTCHTRRVTLVIIPCPRVTPDVLLLLQYLVDVSHQTCYSCYKLCQICMYFLLRLYCLINLNAFVRRSSNARQVFLLISTNQYTVEPRCTSVVKHTDDSASIFEYSGYLG